MEEQIERTLFFVKPDCKNPKIDKATALEIVAFLEDKLEGNFERILSVRTSKLSKEFYLDFYSQLERDWADIMKKMSAEFAGKNLAVFIYEGPGIIQRVKGIAGPTQYVDNVGRGTIREVFGNPDMYYRTIVHASDKESVEKDFSVFKRWRLIPDYL